VKIKNIIGLLLVFSLIFSLSNVSAFSSAGLDSPAQTNSITIKVKVINSSGAPIAGAKVQLGGGSWATEYITDQDGAVSYDSDALSGRTKARVTANGRSVEKYLTEAAEGELVFQTSKVTIRLVNHEGAPLSGGKVERGGGGWEVFGTTNEKGEVYYEHFAGEQDFRLTYNERSETKSIDIIKEKQENVLVFQTGLVDLQFSGNIKYGKGSWHTYSRPEEMLPVEQRFRLSGNWLNDKDLFFIPIAGSVLEKSIFCIRLRINDVGVKGGAAELGVGDGGLTMGETDSNGLLLFIHDGKVISPGVRMHIPSGSTLIIENQEHAKNSFYDFAAKESDGGNPGSGEIPDGNVNPGGNENPGSSETPGSGDSGGASIPLSPGTPTPPRIPLGMPATGSPKAGSALAVLFIMLSLCAGTWVAHPIKRAKGL